MFDHLGALNTPVTDSDLVQVILNGLGPSYRPFIRSLQQRTEDVTYDELYGLLLCEEEDLTTDVKSPIPPSAHIATTPQRGGRFSSGPRGRGGRFNRGRGRS